LDLHAGMAQAAGLTLAEIRGTLEVRDGGAASCSHVADLLECKLREIGQRIADLEKTRYTLVTLAAHAEAQDAARCGDDETCSIFTTSAQAR
jgi:DNA-binding transcriptional MerR regulator